MIEALSRPLVSQAVRFLAERPIENVFLQWLLQHESARLVRERSVYVWRDRTTEIAGVAYFGSQYVLSTQEEPALHAFAAEARRHEAGRMLVGPKAVVDRFWPLISAWHVAPRAVRASQPVYVVDRAHLRGSRSDAGVRRARRLEAAAIAEHSAQMMRGELGYDPRSAGRRFDASVRQVIERGWWWVWFERAALRFMCNVGSLTRETAQLQGVWTPPEHRGQGFATRGLGAICDRLLDDVPTLSLYVNDFNLEAIALYERLGFRRVGEFSTYLFV